MSDSKQLILGITVSVLFLVFCATCGLYSKRLEMTTRVRITNIVCDTVRGVFGGGDEQND